MLLFVENKYGTIQVNSSNTNINIKDLRQAFRIAKANNYECSFTLWNDDMAQRYYRIECAIGNICYLLDKLVEYGY